MVGKISDAVQHLTSGRVGLVRGSSTDGTTTVLWLPFKDQEDVPDDKLKVLEPEVIVRIPCTTCGVETGQILRDGVGICVLCKTQNPAGDKAHLSPPRSSRPESGS